VFKVEFRSVTEVGVRENSSEEASLGLHYFESVAARPSAVSNAMRAVKEPLLNDRGYASRGNGTPARQVIRRAPRARRVSIAEDLVYPTSGLPRNEKARALWFSGPSSTKWASSSARRFRVETRTHQCGATSPCANRPPAFTGARPLIVIISTAQSDIAGLPRN